jgi:hypothetical protein
MTGNVSLDNFLSLFKDGLTKKFKSGRGVNYSSDWYRQVKAAIILRGGTEKDMQKVEDEVFAVNFKSLNEHPPHFA